MNKYLKSSIKQFAYYKQLGDTTISRLDDQQLLYKVSVESNSISVIVNHLSGNMLSRWTDFLTSDGEKSFRNRESEFEDVLSNKTEILQAWNKGWECLFDTLQKMNQSDLEKIVYIRNEGHTVVEAINRQLCHYAYHVGQMVFVGRILLSDKWESLSIPKGASNAFNDQKFSKEKRITHFTDEI